MFPRCFLLSRYRETAFHSLQTNEISRDRTKIQKIKENRLHPLSPKLWPQSEKKKTEKTIPQHPLNHAHEPSIHPPPPSNTTTPFDSTSSSSLEGAVMYVLRPWRRVSVPRGMGRGGREVERDGRWININVEYECGDGTGREQGRVRTLNSSSFVKGSSCHGSRDLNRSCIIPPSPWNFCSLGCFLPFGFLLSQRNLPGKKELQDSSSQ